MHGHQAVVLLVEIEELTFLLHERARTVDVVTPAVVLASELPARTPRLLAGKVVPHQLVAAVTADVVERVHLTAHVAHDDDGRVGDHDLLGEVAAVAR